MAPTWPFRGWGVGPFLTGVDLRGSGWAGIRCILLISVVGIAVWRGTLGILTFALIGNGLNLLGVDTTYQQTILGPLIIAAVAADQVFRRKSA